MLTFLNKFKIKIFISRYIVVINKMFKFCTKRIIYNNLELLFRVLHIYEFLFDIIQNMLDKVAYKLPCC